MCPQTNMCCAAPGLSVATVIHSIPTDPVRRELTNPGGLRGICGGGVNQVSW